MPIEITPVSFSLWAKDKSAFAKALGESLVETGFAIVSDYAVDQAVIDKAETAARDFFALSEADKRKYFDPQGAGQRGYTPFGNENAKGQTIADQKEFWHTGRDLPADSPYRQFMKDTPSVSHVPEFDAASRALFDGLDGFGNQLLEAIALYLGLEQNWFDHAVHSGNSILRLLHYPPQTSAPPKGSVRAGAHEDINLITLLLGAQEAGLQAKHRSGVWLDVNPPAGALVINSGDMLQRLTGGVLPSTTHRVLNPSPERAKFARYSMPFFLHPNYDFEIKMLDGCAARGGKAEPPITAGDYLTERLREIGLIKG